jgi:hypothetical protein
MVFFVLILWNTMLQGISSAGSFVFSDGFESGNLSGWTGSTNMSVQQQLVEAGSWAARATSTGKATYAYKKLSTTYTELYYRIFFDLVSNSSTVALVRFRTASSGIIITAAVNSSSRLFINNPATGKSTVGPVVTKGIWHELQVHILVNGSSSREDVWLDGTAVTALSKTDSLGTAPVGRLDLGDTAGKRTFDVAFDDVVASTSFVDTASPSTPTTPSITSFSDQEVDLSWIASSDNVGVIGYTVYRSTDGGVTYGSVGTSPSTSYADKIVSASSTYSYAVDAFDASGNYSARSAPVTVTTAAPDVTAPSQPTGLAPTKVTAYEVGLTWDPSSDDVGVVGYTVYRSDDGGVTFNAIGTTSSTSYLDQKVSASTAYSYTVDAFDAAGHHSNQSSPVTVNTPQASAAPIQHVVIIDEENHTFNDVLGAFCVEQAAGQITRADVNNTCNGTTQGVLFGGTPYPLTSEPDVGLSINHSVGSQRSAIDGGKMDGFSTISGCTASTSPPYGCLSQYDPLSGPCASSNGSCIPNIAALAERYAISDATFTSAQTPSWAGHMVLGSASIERFVGNNPQPYSGVKHGTGWGCDSGDTDGWNNPDGAWFRCRRACLLIRRRGTSAPCGRLGPVNAPTTSPRSSIGSMVLGYPGRSTVAPITAAGAPDTGGRSVRPSRSASEVLRDPTSSPPSTCRPACSLAARSPTTSPTGRYRPCPSSPPRRPTRPTSHRRCPSRTTGSGRSLERSRRTRISGPARLYS